MTGELSRISDLPASGASVGQATNRSVVFLVMRAARGWWKSKVPQQLANIVGCDVRSAERYLSGDRTMGAEAVFALLRSDVGVKMVEAATADMSPREYREFWNQMALAVVRANLREREEEMMRER